MKLVEAFNRVYVKFKLNFYKNAFMNFGDREATLSTVESFCMEVIYAMNKPTVNEFAKFINVSSPNAAYKVNCLIKKGYVRKVQSTKDKREFYLEVTDKYMKYYNMSFDYIKTVMGRMEKTMAKEDIESLKRILQHMSDQMPEIPFYKDPDMK